MLIAADDVLHPCCRRVWGVGWQCYSQECAPLAATASSSLYTRIASLSPFEEVTADVARLVDLLFGGRQRHRPVGLTAPAQRRNESEREKQANEQRR